MKKFLNRILAKLGLYDSLELEMTVSAQTLADRLAAKTDPYRPDLFDILFLTRKNTKAL